MEILRHEFRWETTFSTHDSLLVGWAPGCWTWSRSWVFGYLYPTCSWRLSELVVKRAELHDANGGRPPERRIVKRKEYESASVEMLPFLWPNETGRYPRVPLYSS